jgi:GNAT superfamily N-acetyltransferase
MSQQLTLPGYRAIAATRDDIPALQAFLEANSAYTRLAEGREVAPDDGTLQFHDAPPPDIPFADRWFFLIRDDGTGDVAAVIEVVKDLLAPGVWHIGLFLVAEALHGHGLAHRLHTALEQWSASKGACWLRLGVIAHNTRAVRFWQRVGYGFVCARQAAATGGSVNETWCLVKPLGTATVTDYLTVQRRDALQSPPPGWPRDSL